MPSMRVPMEPEEVGVRTLRRIARVSEQARPGPPLAAQALEWRIADRTLCHVRMPRVACHRTE